LFVSLFCLGFVCSFFYFFLLFFNFFLHFFPFFFFFFFFFFSSFFFFFFFHLDFRGTMGGGPRRESEEWEILPAAGGAPHGVYADPIPWTSTVRFAVNGTVHAVSNPDPAMSLATFVREELGLRGTKISCAQGGCGACVVYAAAAPAAAVATGTTATAAPTLLGSINSCLRPLAACDGLAFLTVEGIGGKKNGYHPVQQRLAANWGSQCGFCSPGMVMSMYSMLQRAPGGCDPAEIEFAGELDGNICRCTGYRPIVEVGLSFSNAPPKPPTGEARKTPAGCAGVCGTCPSSGSSCGAPVRDIESIADQYPYDPAAHDVDIGAHLAKLGKLGAALSPIKCDGGTGAVTYYRPVTLAQAQQLAGTLSSSAAAFRFVRGNTGKGVYPTEMSGGANLIDLSAVPELLGVSAEAAGTAAVFGSSVPITVLIDSLRAVGKSLPAAQADGVFPALLAYLGRVAHTHVRNAGSWAGNLMMAKRLGFASDLATVLYAIGATVTYQIGSAAAQSGVSIGDFMSVADDPALLVVSLSIPYPAAGDLLVTDKCALRPQNSHSLLNAAMYGSAANGAKALTNVRIVFGALGGAVGAATAMLGIPIRATKTEAALENQPLSVAATLSGALAAAAAEVVPQQLDEFVTVAQPDGKLAYRTALVESFVYRFVLRACQATGAVAVPGTVAAAASVIPRTVMQATTAYSPVDPSYAPVTQALPKLAALLQTSGEALYTNDRNRPRSALHAAYVTSPFATGGFAIDKASAATMPGVVSILVAADVPGSNDSAYGGEPIFADGTVLYAGQPVALIVASTHDAAVAAAAAVKVTAVNNDGAAPTPVLTTAEAVAAKRFYKVPAAPALAISSGDVDAALAAAARVSKVTIECGSQQHYYLEHQTTTAYLDESSRIVLECATQLPADLQKCVSGAVGLPPLDVIVDTRRLGGAYGGKLSRSVPVACATAVATLILGVPVAMYLPTDTDYRFIAGRNGVLANAVIGYDESGVISAVRLDSYLNAGATLDASLGVAMEYNQALDSCYAFPNAEFNVSVCRTDLPTRTAIRSFGHIQAAHVTESIIECVAEALNLDPVQVRARNMYTDRNCITPYGQPVLNYTMPDIWTRLMAASDYTTRLAEVQAFNSANRFNKRGLSVVPVKYGIAWETANALVCVNAADASVVVRHGGVEMGNGINVKVAQAVAMVLGCGMDKIRVASTNTDSVPNIQATGGSAGSGSNSQAARLAALDVMKNLAETRLVWSRANAGKTPTWEQLVAAAGSSNVNLVGSGYFQAGPGRGGAGTGIDGAWNTNDKQYYTFAAGAVEVELDTLTGDLAVRRVDILYDAGKSMNPAVDIGQIEGAFVMGMGYFACEEVGVAPDGTLRTDGTWTYKPPSIGMVPEVFNVTLYDGERGGFARGVLGSKGVGEPPLITSRAVYSATRAAINAARKDAGATDPLPFDAPLSIDRRKQAAAVAASALTI
jgi:xanthine dehydrogenase/oxidase